MAYDLNTVTLGSLFADPRVVEIIDRHAPGVSSNPMLAMAKGMTANQALGMAGNLVDEATITAIKTDVAALD